MRWRWDDVYLLPVPLCTSRYPCISVHPRSLLMDVFGGCDRANLDMHFQAVIEGDLWCTWMLWSGEIGGVVGYQQNVNRSGSHTQPSLTLQLTLHVLLSTSRCFQGPLELWKELSDSARAFSSAPKFTCRYGGEFRILRDLTGSIVNFWSSGDLLRRSVGDLVPYSHSSGS